MILSKINLVNGDKTFYFEKEFSSNEIELKVINENNTKDQLEFAIDIFNTLKDSLSIEARNQFLEKIKTDVL